jgi:serine/threonine protein kinase
MDDSEFSLTQMGEAIGTHAYMSPEQATGRLHEVSPQSDVYSLGATLYCLLTGRPPIADSDVATANRKVQRGRFSTLGDVKSCVPRALQAICLKAMSKSKSNRYVSSKELANDIENWLADEPTSAWKEPLPIRIRRWSKRRLNAPANIALLALLILFFVATAYVRQSLRNGRLADLWNPTRRLEELQMKQNEIRKQEHDLRQRTEGLHEMERRLAERFPDEYRALMIELRTSERERIDSEPKRVLPVEQLKRIDSELENLEKLLE